MQIINGVEGDIIYIGDDIVVTIVKENSDAYLSVSVADNISDGVEAFNKESD